MKFFTKVLLLTLSFCLSINAFTQQSDKVSIKTVGQGKTISDATANALREAISQAYGVFISANTTILNDSLLKDEIVSLTTGNIEKYDVLSQTEIPNIGYSVILNSVVSLGKLSSFAQSKGAEVSFDGGGFAVNIKLLKMNEQAEFAALDNLLSQALEYINFAVSFELQVGQPVYKEEEGVEQYQLSIDVVSTINDSNKATIEAFIFDGLSYISMDKNEISTYQSLSKPIYNLISNRLGMNFCYSLRNKESLDLLMDFSTKANSSFERFILLNNINQNLVTEKENQSNLKPLKSSKASGRPPVSIYYTNKSIEYLYIDSDGDKIVDFSDHCPSEFGSVYLKGCLGLIIENKNNVKDTLIDLSIRTSQNNSFPDKDNDGLFDYVDDCPNKAGPKENRGCPYNDSDNDGIIDNDDDCPSLPGPMGNKGCPYKDSDNDGLLDRDDNCPNTPGPKSNKGCPELKINDLDERFVQIPFKSDALGFDEFKSVTFSYEFSYSITELEKIKEFRVIKVN